MYENKDNQEILEYEVELGKEAELLRKVFEKLNYVRECVQKKELPEKPVFPKAELWRCDYCDFRDECNKDYNLEEEEKCRT